MFAAVEYALKLSCWKTLFSATAIITIIAVLTAVPVLI
jgi:hypothetical protein